MGAKSKKERGVSVSNTNYGGSTSEAGTSRNTNAGSNGKDERLEQLQADHELFLQAFEKPTQIYRFLRTRNMISPIFLNRNLSFMKHRSMKSNASEKQQRKDFKVDHLLDIKKKESEIAQQSTNGFMTMKFLGYYEKKGEKTQDKVSVEIVLLKSSPKKNKEFNRPFLPLPLGHVEVPVNPSEDHPPNKASAMSIPSESFSLSSGQNKSYSLLVKVHQNSSQVPSGNSFDMVQSQNSGSGDPQGDENMEPSSKRRKIRNGICHDNVENGGKVLGRELVVYDRYSRCLLTEGEYELVLSEISPESSSENQINSNSRKNASWEHISMENSDKAISEQFEVFSMSPTLKFRLSWSNEPAGPMVERPRPLMSRDNSDLETTHRKDKGYKSNRGSTGNGINSTSNEGLSNNHGIQSGGINDTGTGRSSCASSISGSTVRDSNTQALNRVPEKPPRIVYQFLYNNNSRQQTDARNDLHCPWCAMSCMELYALLKHLKLSHPRFLFTYVPIQEGARIDVSVSELYDSTYVGNPHDMISQPPGFAFSRHGPVQRTSITNILVCKPKRNQPSLSEFLEIEENDLNGPYDGQRPFVTGHNRLYHYSTTNLPMPPHAILQPSTEDQVDPPWLMTKICRMIDEFTDVNEGEKEFMKMWNLHVQHYTFVGDCQIPLALKMFIEEKGKELIEKRLYRNFLLHCCNMHEYNVLSPGQVFTAMTQIQRFIRENNLQHHLVHWKDQQKRAIDQKGQPNLTLDTVNTDQTALEQISPRSQRSDFSGIFKKEGKSNFSDSNNASSSHSKDSSSELKTQIKDNSELDGTKVSQVNKNGLSNADILSGSKDLTKNLVSNNKNESNDGMVKNKISTKNEKTNGSLVTVDGEKDVGTNLRSDDLGKNQKIQANGK